eukprot:SM003253S12531  [mRNA]  locus=s3253:594:1459:+ [translate_table: standard]
MAAAELRGADGRRLELWSALAEAEDGRMVPDACERRWQERRRRRRHVVASGLWPLLLVALQLLTAAAEEPEAICEHRQSCRSGSGP